jgi:hypothetical protein
VKKIKACLDKETLCPECGEGLLSKKDKKDWAKALDECCDVGKHIVDCGNCGCCVEIKLV